MNDNKPRATPAEMFRRFDAESDQYLRKEREAALNKVVDAVIKDAIIAKFEACGPQDVQGAEGWLITSYFDNARCVLRTRDRTTVLIERFDKPEEQLLLTFGYDPVDDVALPSADAEEGESAEQFLARNIIQVMRAARAASV